MNIFDGPVAGIKDEIDSGSSGSMFIAKRLKDDGDLFHCVMLERPITWRERSNFKDESTGEYKMQTKWACNVARYDDETLQYAEVCILETGPRRMGEVWDAVEEFGPRKIYRVKRKGKPRDKALTWRVDPVRDLDDKEIEDLKALPKLDIRAGAQNDSYLEDFKKSLATELNRLKWSKEQWQTACGTYFGEYKSPEDMTPLERDELLVAFKKWAEGAKPEDFMRVIVEEPDLSEDKDFF